MRKVKGKQKTCKHEKWVIWEIDKGSKLDRELNAEIKKIKSGKGLGGPTTRK